MTHSHMTQIRKQEDWLNQLKEVSRIFERRIGRPMYEANELIERYENGEFNAN